MKFWVLTFLIFTFTSSLICGGLDLSSMMSGMGTPEPLFPEPFDKELLRMARTEDQVIYLFREGMKVKLQNMEKPNIHNEKMSIALIDYSRLQCGNLLYELKSSERKVRRLVKYLDKLEDKRDFAGLYPISNEEFTFPEWKSIQEIIQNSYHSLSEKDNLSSYIEMVKNNEDFYRKIPLVLMPLIDAEDKWEQWMDIIHQKLSAPALLRVIHWIRAKRPQLVNTKLQNLEQKIFKRFMEKVKFQLRAEMDLGMDAMRVTGIQKTGEFIQYSESLFKGHLRYFIKSLKKYNTRNDMQYFLPLLMKVRSEISSLRSFYPMDTKAKDYIGKMKSTMENMNTILKISSKRDYTEDEVNTLNEMKRFLLESDTDKLVFDQE